VNRNVYFLPLLALLLVPQTRAEALCFEGAVNYVLGSSPVSVFAADLDGDGDADLVVANHESNNISALMNHGDGTFAAPVNYTVGVGPWSVFAADVDADGDLDLLVANYHSNNVSVLKNTGDGFFAVAVNYAAGVGPHSVFAADLDGDGDADLAVANAGSNNVSVLKNNGNGTFAAKVSYAAGDYPVSVHAADLDGDGLTDLVVAHGDNVSVLKNNGNGSFAAPVNYYAAGNDAFSVHAADLDGDGDQDLAVANIGGSNSTVSVLKNTGDGTFATAANYAVGSNPSSVFAADVDADGDLDLLVANSSSADVSVLLNNGDGSFAVAVNYAVGVVPASVFAADLDGDGDADLAVANTGSDNVSVLINCGGPKQPSVLAVKIGAGGDSLHLTDHSPLFSWLYSDPESRPHTKSEIEVGTDSDWAVAEMWQPPTIIGAGTSIQYAGAPLADGATYYVHVRVFSDTLWSNGLVAPFRMNNVPTAPVPLSPDPAQIVLTGRPNLIVMNATDAQGDVLHYDFEVYRDSALTVLEDSIEGTAEGSAQTEWQTDSLTAENQRHWWRVRASDGYENGPWSDAQSFWVDAYNQPPAVFDLLSPSVGAVIYDLTPSFAWSQAVDPDPGVSLTYSLTLGLDSLFTFHSDVGGTTTTSYDWLNSLPTGINYYWKVRADDGRGGTVTSAVRSFKTTSLGDENGDGAVDVFDVIMLIDYVFSGGTPPNPASVADVNGDCVADVFDVIYLIDYAFSGGPAPVAGCAPLRTASSNGGR